MRVVISWNELPKYAAYPISEVIKKNPKIEIVSIKSKLPIKNLEKILNKKIYWIKNYSLPLYSFFVRCTSFFIKGKKKN